MKNDIEESVQAYRKRKAARLKSRMDAQWEENEHPRGKDGKFTSGGSGNNHGSKPKASPWHGSFEQANIFSGLNPMDKGMAEWARMRGYYAEKSNDGSTNFFDKSGKKVSTEEIMKAREKAKNMSQVIDDTWNGGGKAKKLNPWN